LQIFCHFYYAGISTAADLLYLTSVGSGEIHSFTTNYGSILTGNLETLGSSLYHIIMPAFTLGFATLALILRMTRSSMLEVMGMDYIRTARAKGLSERKVIFKHALRNALIPTVTVSGLQFGALLGGAVLTESIFNWPGMGRFAANAVLGLDFNSVMGFTLGVAIIYVIANLIVDLLYAVIDPRVKLGGI